MIPPQPPANITIHIPLPNIDISEKDLYRVKSLLQKDGKTISIRGEEGYPIAFSWVGIAIDAAIFLGVAAASHYAEKLFEALDSTLKKGIEKICPNLLKGKIHSQVELDRQSKQEAIESIRKALEELEK